METIAHIILGVSMTFLVGALYFAPYIVAARRGATARLAILALNFFLGWTLIGWVLLLVWATASRTDEDEELRRLDLIRARRDAARGGL